MDKKGGNVIFMPDIEYRSWVNRNSDLLSEIQTRYFNELGYNISLD